MQEYQNEMKCRCGDSSMLYHKKIRCYSCHKQVKGTVYVEKEVNPYAFVPICERCISTWHLIKDLEKKQLIRYVPNGGVRLASKGRNMAKLLSDYGHSER